MRDLLNLIDNVLTEAVLQASEIPSKKNVYGQKSHNRAIND